MTPSPPRIIWTFLNLGKNWFSMTPPPRPKLGKIWNVDYFDIVAHLLTLAKTIPKSYKTDTWGLFYSYIGHICTKWLHISHQYQSHIYCKKLECHSVCLSVFPQNLAMINLAPKAANWNQYVLFCDLRIQNEKIKITQKISISFNKLNI